MAVSTSLNVAQLLLQDIDALQQPIIDPQKRLTVAILLKTSCGACKTMFPYVERLHRAYSEAVHFVGVSQDNADKTRRFATRAGCTFPFLLDTSDFTVSRLFNPVGVPAVYVLDGHGDVVWSHEGYSRESVGALVAKIGALTGAHPLVVYDSADTSPAFRPACESKHRLVDQGLLDED